MDGLRKKLVKLKSIRNTLSKSSGSGTLENQPEDEDVDLIENSSQGVRAKRVIIVEI